MWRARKWRAKKIWKVEKKENRKKLTKQRFLIRVIESTHAGYYYYYYLFIF